MCFVGEYRRNGALDLRRVTGAIFTAPSDCGENKPASPDNPRGAYTAARAAKDQHVPVSAITFGTRAAT